ncbi:pantetheine-phosphate adenylyltransferase [Candidatus Aquarickettsia rohweri]|uniref:Phosphopantetheine adenylyltransferase n=2 Tax=Candidatus Aquarickettsia rohweri TaxID=2602574 RepID=A0A3R9ZRF1_9RICK|nr:pantetheine-phosphate adenylyltransferase [Candidatus Aquarickettsia rohweri]RST70063.1 pantetheine-phosphate adenylyltransferase [Candidatus Aquarickettsia rohweri]
MTNKKTAVYPGTFDPITLGHLDIIKRSAILFDKLIIGIAENSQKSPLFSANDRVDMIKYELDKLYTKNIVVKSFNGLLVEFVKKESAHIIIRGLRAVADFEYEFQMSFVNKTLENKIETVFLPATENVHFISSTFVKEVTKLGGNTKKLVSQNVQKLLIEKFKNV